MATHTPAPPLQALTPALRDALVKSTDLSLLRIIRANVTSQYASGTLDLAPFRDAIAQHGETPGPTLLANFRAHVPVTDYASYKPWIARFNETPCEASRVENLLAPGFPYYFAQSSSTSGMEPKLLPMYKHPRAEHPRLPSAFSGAQGPIAHIFYYGWREVKTVEREPGHVVKRIPLCLASGGVLRLQFDWDVDSDTRRLSRVLPGHVAPWGAGMITNSQSYFMIHALFCLACSDLDQIFVTFIPVFVDLVRVMDQAWEELVASIREGKVPDLDGIDHMQEHLQVALNANPARADALCDIGPPSSGVGWAARVWPRMRRLGGICSGSFGTSLGLVRAILGPTIAIRNHGYNSSESTMSVFFDPDDLNTFVFETEDVIEFLNAEGTCPGIMQGWDLQPGRRCQVVVTTRNGLWRYLMDDIIQIVGFNPRNGAPVFKYLGRKSFVIRLLDIVISDTDLVSAIQTILSEGLVQVVDFTTVLDERDAPKTVGFLVEPSGPLGSEAYRVAQRLSDALSATNSEYAHLVRAAKARLPTVRIMAKGTFMAYRQWRGERMGIGLGQVKVPVVMKDIESQRWIAERVVEELYAGGAPFIGIQSCG